MKMRKSAVSIAAKKSITTTNTTTSKSILLSPFEELEKRVTKLHLPENWQIKSSSDYYPISKHDTIHDVPIFDTYIRKNLEFTRVFAVCIPAYEI